MDESSITQNRRTRRSNVLLAASIDVSGTVMPVRLRNLSTEGALIEGERLPIEGSQVVFRRNELSIGSRVAWVHGRYAGIAFRKPIHQEDVLRNIPKPRGRVPVQFRRPGLAYRQLTPEEQRLAESWAWRPSRDVLGE